MSFFSRKSELALVFDIGSSAVGAGLVRLARGEPAKVLHTVREAIPHQKDVDPGGFFQDMIDALKKAHENISKEGAGHLAGTEFKHVDARRVFYSFASPWAVTQTQTLCVTKQKPFVFTHQFLDGLMKDEEDKFKKETLTVVERKIIQTRLNGYEIKDPFGKEARETEISYWSGIMPKSVLDKVMEASHAAHEKNVKVFTFSLVAYGTIREAFPKESDFIQVRLGGEITDASIVESGLITESASFPQGENHVLRAIAAGLNMSKEEAASFLKLYSEGHAEPNLAAKYEPVISKCAAEWVASLREVLGKLENGMFLPPRLFLMTDGALPGLFSKALESAGNAPFNVSVLDAPLALISSFAGHAYESEKK